MMKNNILGNYYGLIYLEYIKPGRVIKMNYDAIEIKYNKKPLLEKIKSIAVTSNHNKEIKEYYYLIIEMALVKYLILRLKNNGIIVFS